MFHRRRLARCHKATMRRLWVVMAGARERRALWEDVERMLKTTRHLTAELEPLELDLFDTETMETLVMSKQTMRLWEYA